MGPDSRRPERADTGERGSAVVDFVLVGVLVTVLLLGVVQLAAVLHVRNVLIDCASQGARYGALADRDPEAGVERTRALIAAALSPEYARDVSAGRAVVDGLETVEVRVRAPLPIIGLLGTGRALDVSGHAVAER